MFGDSRMYPGLVFMGKLSPLESLENTINTMGTLLGVHPIVQKMQNMNFRVDNEKTPTCSMGMEYFTYILP